MKWQSARRRFYYHGLVEPRELRIAELLVGEFCGPGKAFPIDEWDDVLQEVLSRWVLEREKWRADRGASLETFMHTVVRNDLRDLVEKERAEKQRLLRHARSLNEPAGDDPDGPVLGEVLLDDRAEFEETVDRKLDVARTLLELTDRQQDIADLLGKMDSVTAVAEHLGLSRDTVHRDIRRIRQLFERRGLREYLKKGSDTLG